MGTSPAQHALFLLIARLDMRARMYMHKVKTEINPLQKAQYYQISERLLQTSAASCKRAKKPEKGEDVRRLLKSVQEERELALSLTEVLRIPSIVSTTDSFLTPNPTLEKAVGLERFEHTREFSQIRDNEGTSHVLSYCSDKWNKNSGRGVSVKLLPFHL